MKAFSSKSFTIHKYLTDYENTDAKPKSKRLHCDVKLSPNYFLALPYCFVLCKDLFRPTSSFPKTNSSLDWKSVQVVIVPYELVGTCPICLEFPVLPRMTGCSHLFCYECILRYLMLDTTSDSHTKKLVAKCPVCSSVVVERDLRAVKVEYEYGLDALGEFVLMRRNTDPDSIPIPVSLAHRFTNAEPVMVESMLSPYVKVVYAEDLWFANFFSNELSQVLSGTADEKEKFIVERIESAISRFSKNVMQNDQASIRTDKLDHFSAKPPTSSKSIDDAKCPDIVEQSESKDVTDSVHYFYFYQRIDYTNGFSLHLLDPLCIKILLKEFCAYKNFPPSLPSSIPLIDSKASVMADSVYKKFHYLSHISKSTVLSFDIVDLSSVISHAVMQGFVQELNSVHAKKIHRLWSENSRQQSILQEHNQMLEQISRSFENRCSISSDSAVPPGTRMDDDFHFPSLSTASLSTSSSSSISPQQQQPLGTNVNKKRYGDILDFGCVIGRQCKFSGDEFPALQ